MQRFVNNFWSYPQQPPGARLHRLVGAVKPYPQSLDRARRKIEGKDDAKLSDSNNESHAESPPPPTASSSRSKAHAQAVKAESISPASSAAASPNGSCSAIAQRPESRQSATTSCH